MEPKILQAIFNFLSFMYVEVLPACVSGGSKSQELNLLELELPDT